MIGRNDAKLVSRFVCVGGVGFLCNYFVLRFSTDVFFLHKIQGEIIAAIIALQVTFFMHDNWTYELHKDTESFRYKMSFSKRYGSYIASNSFGSIMTVGLFGFFSTFFSSFIALGSAAVLAMIWNFIINKFFIWRHRPLPMSDN